MGKAYYNCKKNTASSIHSKQFLYKQNFKQSNFYSPVLRSLQRRETTWSIDEWSKQVSKQALITSWIQNCPFHCENFTCQHNLRCFYADKVSCNTNKATRSKTKKLTFSLAAMKFCNSMLRATPAVPTQTFFRLRINGFLVGKILLLFHQKTALCCMLILFHVEMK